MIRAPQCEHRFSISIRSYPIKPKNPDNLGRFLGFGYSMIALILLESRQLYTFLGYYMPKIFNFSFAKCAFWLICIKLFFSKMVNTKSTCFWASFHVLLQMSMSSQKTSTNFLKKGQKLSFIAAWNGLRALVSPIGITSNS